MDYAVLLKSPPFIISKVGDPEQLLQVATGVGGEHTLSHQVFGACT